MTAVVPSGVKPLLPGGRGRGGIRPEVIAKLPIRSTDSVLSRTSSGLAVKGVAPPPSVSVRSESQGRKLVREHTARKLDDENTVTLRKSVDESLGATFEANLRLSHISEGDSPARRAGLAKFINRRLTHIGGMPVHSADEVKAAAKDAATMALRFEEQRKSSSSRPSSARTISPSAIDDATKASLLRQTVGRTRAITLSHKDIEWTVRLPDASLKRNLDEEVKKFGVEGHYVLKDDFGASVKPTDVVDGRTYTVVASTPPETPAHPVHAADAASNPSQSPSPTESRKGRLANMLEQLAQDLDSNPDGDDGTATERAPTPPQAAAKAPATPAEDELEMSVAEAPATDPAQARREREQKERREREEEDRKSREREEREEKERREREEREAKEREEEREANERRDREAREEREEARRQADEERERDEERQREDAEQREREVEEARKEREREREMEREAERQQAEQEQQAAERRRREQQQQQQQEEEEEREREEARQRRSSQQTGNVPFGQSPTPTRPQATRHDPPDAQKGSALDFSDASGSDDTPPRRKKQGPKPVGFVGVDQPRDTASDTQPAKTRATDEELWTDFVDRLSGKGCRVQDILRCTPDEMLLLCEVQLRFSTEDSARIERQWQQVRTHSATEPSTLASPSSLSIQHAVMEGRRDSISPGTDLFTQVESVVMSSITCSPDIAVQVTRIRQLIPGARICGKYKAAKESLRTDNRQKKVLYFAGPSMPPLTEVTSDALFGEMKRTGCLVFSTEAHIVGGPSAASTATKKLLLCEVLMGCVARPSSRRASSRVGPLPDCSGLRKMLVQEQDRSVQAGVAPPDTLAIDYPYATEGSDEGLVATQYVTGDAARVLPRYVVYLKVRKSRSVVSKPVSRRRKGSPEPGYGAAISNSYLAEALTLKASLVEEECNAVAEAEENRMMIEQEFDRLQRELLAKRKALQASAAEIREAAHTARCRNAQVLDAYVTELKELAEAGVDISQAAPLPDLADSTFGFSLHGTAEVKGAIHRMQLHQG